MLVGVYGFSAAIFLMLAAFDNLRSSHASASRSQRRRLRDEFFVQPVTAVVAPPNLSAHKPAGNCAPRDDDRA